MHELIEVFRMNEVSIEQTAIEPITVIQDWKLSFCLGNVIKYIGRADHKGDKLADLEKAADYLRMEIESMKR